MILLIAFAFLAGVITILSPCILPILPIVLSSTIGGQEIGKSRPLGVVIGFVLSFTFFTLFLSTIVRLSGISADTLRLVSVLVIAGFGASLLFSQFQVLVERLFSKLAEFMPSSQNRTGFGSGLVIGLSVGLLWTPCVGPILASVISLAITGAVTFDAFLIILAYSLGTAIPMFVIMIGGQNILKKIPWLLANTSRIQKAFGGVMMLTALGIFFNIDRKFQTYIVQAFPWYGVGLNKFQDVPVIKNELQKLESKPTVQQQKSSNPLSLLEPDYGEAPEFILGGQWFNSAPLMMKELRGKVVLVDFWTYTCINCIRTLPYLKNWHQKYKDKGLVIVGVHTPEFEFEKTSENVAKAIKDFGLEYPIMQDNNYATWQAYNNRYWPAKYFIDKNGYIRRTHFGEGEYDKSEEFIQKLLEETGVQVDQTVNNPQYQINSRTPELYLGYRRIHYFVSPENIKQNALATYTSPANLGSNQVAYEGNWNVMGEYANPQKGAKLHLNFESKELFLVMRTIGNPAKVKVYLDDKLQDFGEDNKNGMVTVDADRLYKLINLPTPGRHMLRLEFDDNNAQLFAFTFG